MSDYVNKLHYTTATDLVNERVRRLYWNDEAHVGHRFCPPHCDNSKKVQQQLDSLPRTKIFSSLEMKLGALSESPSLKPPLIGIPPKKVIVSDYRILNRILKWSEMSRLALRAQLGHVA